MSSFGKNGVEKLRCVLPSRCPMNDNWFGFIHQGGVGGDVVIKVLLSLFSHSAECVVKGGWNAGVTQDLR